MKRTKLIFDNYQLEIDCTISIDDSKNARVTKHKVEDGSEISDHTIDENQTMTLKGIISNGMSNQENSPSQVKFQLEKYLRKKCTVKSTNKIYENYILSSVSTTRSSNNTDALDFSLGLEEIRTTKTKISKINKKVIEKKNPTNNKELEKKIKDSQARYNEKISKGKEERRELEEKAKKQANNNINKFKKIRI
jgi:hypothetical protein